MKKSKILLMVLASMFLLASCGEVTDDPTPEPDDPSGEIDDPSKDPNIPGGEEGEKPGEEETPEPVTFDDVLKSYQKGYKLSATFNESYGEVNRTFYSETQVEDGKLTYRMKNNENDTEFRINETYIKGENGRVLSTRLDVSNTLNTYTVYNPSTSNPFMFDEDGYSNFFKLLEASDFEVKDQTYTLKMDLEDSDAIYESISTQLYGNPGLVLDTFVINLDEAGIESIDSTLSFKGASVDYSYTAEIEISPLGENVTIEVAYSPFEEVEDATFDDAFEKLKQGNYTVTVDNYDGDVLSFSSIFKTTKDGIYYKTPAENDDFYEIAFALNSEDGLIYEASKGEDGNYYFTELVGMEGSLDELRPSLAIARECFDYNAETSTYTMKDGVEGDTGALTILPVVADIFDDISISIKDNEVVVTNIYSDQKTVLTFSNIGTTTQDFTYESFLQPAQDVLLKNLIDPTVAVAMLNFMSSEDIDALVAPSTANTSEYIEFGDVLDVYLMLVYSDDSITVTESMLTSYGETLEGLGYSPYDEPMLGGYAYTKTTTLDFGNSVTTYIEALDYEGYFTIIISTPELLAENL